MISGYERIKGERRMNGCNIEVIENTLHAAIMAGICHYTLVKTQRMNTKREPQYKLWTLGNDDVPM
jgi:hypothetical protein